MGRTDEGAGAPGEFHHPGLGLGLGLRFRVTVRVSVRVRDRDRVRDWGGEILRECRRGETSGQLPAVRVAVCAVRCFGT